MDNLNLNDQDTTQSTSVRPIKKNNKEKFLIIIIFSLLILLIVAFAYIKIQKSFNWGQDGTIINKNNISVEVPGTIVSTSTVGTKALLPGASLVTPDAQVINSKFEAAKNDAIPNSPEAPRSVAISQNDLPKETLNLKITGGKITPNSFTVKAGDLISLAVTSSDNEVHIFGFYNGAMSAIAMGISEGQTKAINFNAPAPGEYNFGCGVPQHKENGERGTMTVK